MASIVKLGKGKQPPRAIDVVDLTDGRKRKRIRIGVVSHDDAVEFKRRIQNLLGAKILNRDPKPEMLEWLTGLPPAIYDRIAKTGLLESVGAAPAEPSPAALDRSTCERPTTRVATSRSRCADART